MKDFVDEQDLEALVSLAFKEDIKNGDVTSDVIFNKEDVSRAEIVSKEDGVFCGGEIVEFVYRRLSSSVNVELMVKDGTDIKKGQILVRIVGPTSEILKGERIILNFLQRMSGIATKTKRYVSLVENTPIKILDTRKTLPGFRMLDKYSVKCGGGTNHRRGLFDMVMIKDNHIKAAGSIAEAVRLVRETHGTSYRIEVETTNHDEVREARDSGADIIMLDNMDRENVSKAIRIIDGKSEIEVSGNMDEHKIREIQDLNVDYISAGSLTHSVDAFDLSMKFI